MGSAGAERQHVGVERMGWRSRLRLSSGLWCVLEAQLLSDLTWKRSAGVTERTLRAGELSIYVQEQTVNAG